MDAPVQIRVSFQLYSFMLLFFWHRPSAALPCDSVFGSLSAVITVQKKVTFNGIMRKTWGSEHSRTHDARSGGDVVEAGGVAQADKKQR